MTELPAAVRAMAARGPLRAMAARGPRWAAWVERLPALAGELSGQWQLRPDGPPTHGYCSLVVPVRAGGEPAVLKIGFPDEESEHEHLALRNWGGRGAVRLLRADPHRGALLLERLRGPDLSGLPDTEACRVVGGLYPRLHIAPTAPMRSLSALVEQWSAQLAELSVGTPIPRRLAEQAVGLGRDLAADRAVADRLLHTDLHYANVLAGAREPWLAIDPKPVNGDPHYEVAPMLWNRWAEISGDVRAGVRRRLSALLDVTGFDAARTRAWVIVRMAHNAMWAVGDDPDPAWLTVCVAVAKAVQE